MNRDEIVAALTALGEALDRRGVEGEMYVVDGAAMALAYDSRCSTRDIDARFFVEELFGGNAESNAPNPAG